MENFTTMTIEQAVAYCHKHREAFIRDWDTADEGIAQFDTLVSLLVSQHINPAELPDYGMEY